MSSSRIALLRLHFFICPYPDSLSAANKPLPLAVLPLKTPNWDCWCGRSVRPAAWKIPCPVKLFTEDPLSYVVHQTANFGVSRHKQHSSSSVLLTPRSFCQHVSKAERKATALYNNRLKWSLPLPLTSTVAVASAPGQSCRWRRYVDVRGRPSVWVASAST